MAFSTRDARRQKMSGELRSWCETGEPEDHRTLILRLSPQADLDQLSEKLKDLEVKILSLGAAVTVVEMSCLATQQVSEFKDVLSIDMPTRLSPKLTDSFEPDEDP